MRRRAIIKRVIVFLVLGAIVNVAVAWTCAFASHTTSAVGVQSSASIPPHVPSEIDSSWFKSNGIALMFLAQQSAGRGVRMYQIGLEESGGGSNGFRTFRWIHLEAVGLPFPSLRALGYLGWMPSSGEGKGSRIWEWHGAVQRFGKVQGQILYFTYNKYARPIPLRPLWPGFAVNTLFYATLLWLLLFGPPALRRFIRRKRGRCVACAYDLRGVSHVRCPECGVPVNGPVRNQLIDADSSPADSPPGVSDGGGN